MFADYDLADSGFDDVDFGSAGVVEGSEELVERSGYVAADSIVVAVPFLSAVVAAVFEMRHLDKKNEGAVNFLLVVDV